VSAGSAKNKEQPSLPRQASPQSRAGAAGRSPRRLSTHQQAVLIQVLASFRHETVRVCYLPSVSDALNYAEDFSTIFRAINWTVDPAERVEPLPESSSGLAIVVPEGKVPSSAEALRDALRIYRLEAEIVSDQWNLCGARNFVLAITKA
jgi:hypothetical protein